MNHYHVGGVAQGGGQRRGQPHGKDGADEPEGEVFGAEGHRRVSFQPGVLHREKHHRGSVGEGGGDGRPGHLQLKAEDQDGVQNHVQDAAEHHARAGLFGVALAAEQMAQG